MFFVIDKSKILSYIVAICTVVLLFMLASGGENTNEILPTSANVIENEMNIMINKEDNSLNQENI